MVCICNTVQPINNKTLIHILQHPSERNHPIGTVRFAMLGLKQVKLDITYPGWDGSLDLSSNASVANIQNAGLLYPSKNAMDLTTLSPEKKPETLIVLDGTWFMANKLYKENPWLQEIPHYTFTPAAPSRYRIRQEPSDHCISTVEAIVEALRLLEPQTDCSPLLRAFDAMIDRQVAFIESKEGAIRKKRPRRREQRSIPAALSRHFENVVVVYGENIRMEDHRRIMISFCAKRMGDGETFEQFVQVPPDVAGGVKSHGLSGDCRPPLSILDELEPSGILAHHKRHGVSTADFKIAWEKYLRPTDILCAWNKGTLKSLFHTAGHPENNYLFLKAAYGNTVKEKFGTLEDVIQTNQLHPTPTRFLGRAQTRMSNAIAVAHYLNSYQRNK